MLSDEERKAIDYLQLCYDLSTITNESLFKLGIVLNLIKKQSKEIEELRETLKCTQNSWYEDTKVIEKQQKEIEELNLENIELKQSKIVDKNSIPNQDNFYECYNFVSKDKIKAKIEEINKEMLNEENSLELFYRKKYCKEVLQSLLEKE